MTSPDSGSGVSAPASAAGVVRVGLIQHACPPSDSVEQNRKNVGDMIRDAAAQGAQLVATQELFDAPYFPQTEDESEFRFAEPIPGPRTEFLCGLAKELGIHLTGSCFERRAPGLYHNTSLMIDPSGAVVGAYRKMHVPDDPRFYEKFYFAPGDAPHSDNNDQHRGGWQNFALDVAGTEVNAGLLVCWDQWFPEAARLTALQGAQVLFYPSAVGWYHGETDTDRRNQRDAWVTIQRSHAIANGTFVCAINRVGVEDDLTFWGGSFIAAPSGAVIAQAPADRDAVLVADLDLSLIETNRKGWPFLRDRRVDAYGGLLHRYLDGT